MPEPELQTIELHARYTFYCESCATEAVVNVPTRTVLDDDGGWREMLLVPHEVVCPHCGAHFNTTIV